MHLVICRFYFILMKRVSSGNQEAGGSWKLVDSRVGAEKSQSCGGIRKQQQLRDTLTLIVSLEKVSPASHILRRACEILSSLKVQR